MRFLLLFVATLTALWAAQTESLVKVGDVHLKTARYGAAAVADGDYVHVIGDDDGHEILSDIERFDVRTHEIVRLTDRLTARRYHGAVLAEGKIYVFGGQGSNPLPYRESMEAAVDIYDLSTGLITQASRMPTPRSYAATVLYKGKVYVIGGTHEHGNALVQTGLMEIYDLASGTWSTGPAMPTARECRATVVDDFIVVPGGYRSNARLAQVEFFVPSENAWKRLPDLCGRVSANSVAFLGGHLFLFGNFSNEKDVVDYDLRTRTSRVIRPDYLPARHTAAVVHAGCIYVVGGNLMRGNLTFDDIQVFKLATTP